MPGSIKIGTRGSELAIWQATRVKEQLENQGISSQLQLIKSKGDIDLESPLHLMDGQGVFTQALNVALLQKKIDIAVHSMKDMPTKLPVGIRQCCVLPRGSVYDLLVIRTDQDFLTFEKDSAVIATGSLRRRAQWLARYPTHRMVDLRGNVNSRLTKLKASNWDGAIFAQAGLQRIGLQPHHVRVLDWMLPAPAQGAMQVVCREDDQEIIYICQRFNDEPTHLCTNIERDFMRSLEGGCASPIGALAIIKEGTIYFKGNLTAPDGSASVQVQKTAPVSESADLGALAAEELLERGGAAIMGALRRDNGMRISILSTKSLSESLVHYAKARGIHITQHPFIRIRPVISIEKEKELTQWLQHSLTQVVLFTSANAVILTSDWMRRLQCEDCSQNWKVYCISGTTLRKVEEVFPKVQLVGTADDASALATRVIHDQVDRAVLFCGNLRRNELPEILRKGGITLQEIKVYDTEKLFKKLTRPFDGILFFSPSAVESYFEVNSPQSRTVFFAIGPMTAATIARFTKRRVIVCRTLSATSMVELACHYFSKQLTDKHESTA